jgi:NLR family CARD domain-containing protein 3
MQYLEETMEDNEALEIVIQGNDKHNFNNRVSDQALIALCSTLEQFAIYIEDIDLRYNDITDEGAQALADLISKSPRLLGLNIQGNKIKSEGA